ncbi:hypothetical protein EVAR_23241_1 [Eumeta japonica]|uniref:Uncharacterized protein n=1 Tax=Eumeta variegata TaxID=151549 RepID=A0A4C1VCR7_EUMVA|nr:hypothetical protein EVAR_23241_1 [Eumeta japonica]
MNGSGVGIESETRSKIEKGIRMRMKNKTKIEVGNETGVEIERGKSVPVFRTVRRVPKSKSKVRRKSAPTVRKKPFRPIVYEDTTHPQNSLLESFKTLLFIVEEFHCRRKLSRLHRSLVYEDAIHHQNVMYENFEVYALHC